MTSQERPEPSSAVQVVVRLRPLNDREKKHGTLPVVSASTNDKTVTAIKGSSRSQFAFDNVFTAFSTQEEVFESTLKPVIKDVMMGYESTVFAYGQTGTGKTYTMEGCLENPDNYGVIPRSAESIFDELNNEERNYESFQVHCSYLEIYNEDLGDLLNQSGTPSSPSKSGSPRKNGAGGPKLEIMEGLNGPFCRGLSEKEVRSADDLLSLMKKAQQQRKVGETSMNEHSSRSHCIFTLRVEAKRRLPDGALLETRGKLHLVDLAGSECAKSANLENGGSGQQAARERERMNINRSLLTLGRVIKILKEQSTKSKPRNVRIPYRDSKLTRILQQALGGNSKTVIIGTLSPSVVSIEESISTLNYAQAAHGIINKPVSASYLSEATKASPLLSGMETSSSTGPQSLEGWREMEIKLEYMGIQVEEAKAALARKHMQQQEIIDRAEKAEAENAQMEDRIVLVQQKADSLQNDLEQSEAKREAVEKELVETKEQLEKTNVELEESEAKRAALEKELDETRTLLEKTTLVLQATQITESSLTNEALSLIDALKKSLADGDHLYGLLLSNRESDLERRAAAKEFNSSVVALLTDVKQTLTSLSDEESVFKDKTSELANLAASKETKFLEDAKEALCTAASVVSDAVVTLKSSILEEDGIVPTASLMAENAVSGIENARSVVKTSEEKLVAQFTSTQEQMTKFGARLNELEEVHATCAAETISIVKDRVESSRQKVEHMVSTTDSALAKAREDRKKIRDTTKETVEQWKRSMISSGDVILKESTEQREKTSTTEAMMTTEMQRHDNIATHLSSQGILLENSQKKSASSHEEQKELLQHTQSSMEASHSSQTQLLSNFVARLMKDVESLVQTQVSEVLQEVETGHASFQGNHSSLMENHANITSSTLDTLAKAEELKASIQKEADFAKENDKTVIMHLSETQSTFNCIEKAATEHEANVARFSSMAVENLQESEDLENHDTTLREELSNCGTGCLDFMSDNLLKDAVERISTQTDSGESIISFTRDDVLETAISAVNEMETPRSEVLERFERACADVEEGIGKGVQSVEEKSSTTTKIAVSLDEGTKLTESKFVNSTAMEHSTAIENTKSSILECVSKHSEFFASALGCSKDGTTKAGSAVELFVKENLSAYEEVPEAPEKVTITYSEDLSSTPPEDEILAAARKLGKENILQVLSPNQDRIKAAKK